MLMCSLNNLRTRIRAAQGESRERRMASICAMRSLQLEKPENECEDWDVAFAHSEMAHAAAEMGDAKRHAEHYSTAKRLGDAIANEEDRKQFLEEFSRIPATVRES